MEPIVWIIIIAVVAIVLIAAIALLARNNRNRRRTAEAEQLREHAREETTKVERREALADETAARARAATAEAEAKAAEATRLEERATTHQTNVASARQEVDKKWEHADGLDPSARGDRGGDRVEQPRHGAREETP